jgi:hypothetical protein
MLAGVIADETVILKYTMVQWWNAVNIAIKLPQNMHNFTIMLAILSLSRTPLH